MNQFRPDRDHFVYTAYDAEGRVLYVGCTKDLDGRMKAHRMSDWYHLASRFHIRGPYTYAAGRQVERERLATDRPLYAFHPARRTLVAIHHRITTREYDRLLRLGMDHSSAIQEASELVTELTGYVTNRTPIHVTDEVLRDAFAAEREYASHLALSESA